MSRTEILTITRVVNPCVLLEFAEDALLTDPYFANHPLFPMNEPIGMRPEQLPPLRAILGGHGAFDHWRLSSLRGAVDFDTPVFCATTAMARRATRTGFRCVEIVEWGEERVLSPSLTVRCVPGGTSFGSRVNHYVISTTTAKVFVGTEARDSAEVHRFAQENREHNQRVDVAVLPIDGLTFARKRLVMNARIALETAVELGAHTLVPIHYSQRSTFGLVHCPSGLDELLQLAASQKGPLPTVRHAPPGTPIRISVGRGRE